MGLTHGGRINGDVMGLGKTHMTIGLILMTELLYGDRWPELDRPILVVCPMALRQQWLFELHSQLGQGWRVYAYGEHVQPAEMNSTPGTIKRSLAKIPSKIKTSSSRTSSMQTCRPRSTVLSIIAQSQLG